MEVKPIIKKRVYQEIISQFVEMIRDGRIETGERLPSERVLAEMFQVSRPSVREALRVLETIGIIDTRPGGGAYVTDLNLAPFINTFAPLITRRPGFEMELLDLRELMEVKAAILTAESADSEILESLEQVVHRMYRALDNKDSEEGSRCDIEFHKIIFMGSNNYILQQASGYVNSLIEISIKGNRELLLKDENNALNLYSEHNAILNAFKKKNSELAGELMAKHIRGVRVLYRDVLS